MNSAPPFMHCLRSAEYVCSAEPEAIIMCSNFIADDARVFVASDPFCDTSESVYGLTALAICSNYGGQVLWRRGCSGAFVSHEQGGQAMDKATASRRT